MEVTLNKMQERVDHMIEVRIARLSLAAYKSANRLPNGRIRKKHKQYTLPGEVTELLELRQKLYQGTDPEMVAATVTSGNIQYAFIK